MRELAFVIAVEVFMTLFISYVILYTYRRREEFNLRRWALITILLVMMASMLNSITYYVAATKTFLNTIVAVSISMLAMSAVIILIFWFAIASEKFTFNNKARSTFVLLLLWNEISMGVLVYLLAFGFPHVSTNVFVDFIDIISLGINGYLFIIPMAVEMLVFLYVVNPGKTHRTVLLSILAMSVFSPVLLGNSFFVGTGLFAEAVAMVLFMTVLFETVSRGKLSLTERQMKDMSFIFLVFVFMTASTFIGTMFKDPFGLSWMFFAMSMVAGMAVYFKSAINENGKVEKRTGWKKRPRFLFWILSSSFISEWFLAASIIFHLYVFPQPGGLADFAIMSNYLGGVSHFTPFSMTVEVPAFIGLVADNQWFWTLMGVEMSSLVVIRMLSLQWKGKRWNLALALTAYWGWTVWFQTGWWSSIFGSWAYRLPFWPNIGELGPFYPFFIAGIIFSYVIFAGLAFFFGRRSYCSTLCPSAVMYGGTLGQNMISYNYDSDFSRKHIGSKYKNSVLTVAYNSWIIAIIFSVLSYYSVTGIPSLNLFGIDTSEFYTTFVWNFLWYIFFITIPFVGMSPCRRYGWCSTGTFVGLFSKIGLFKIKVRSPQTCVTCPTKDCVTNCEVGLGDLASQFIKKGYFKSSKCVGAGSCLEACPYDNIYFYDVRNYVKEKLDKKQS